MQFLFTYKQYLTQDQYKDSGNLDARIEIHKRFSKNTYGWFNWVFDTLVQVPKTANVLELGCGAGTMWKECADRIPAGWAIILSDFSDGMLDAAWRSLIVTGRNFKFENIDAQVIPYQDKTFDVVVSNHMLYHVPDRQRALTEIRRVLKEDGCLIATTVGDHHMKEMNELLRRAITEKGNASFSQSFTLENGLGQLQVVFSMVELTRYEDSLHVTEAEPVMAYIRSAIRAAELSEAELGNIERELTARLVQEGKIFITKDSGMFKAMK